MGRRISDEIRFFPFPVIPFFLLFRLRRNSAPDLDFNHLFTIFYIAFPHPLWYAFFG